MASPVFVVLCWIRSFRYLAFTSILGDVAFVLAMGACLGASHMPTCGLVPVCAHEPWLPGM